MNKGAVENVVETSLRRKKYYEENELFAGRYFHDSGAVRI